MATDQNPYSFLSTQCILSEIRNENAYPLQDILEDEVNRPRDPKTKSGYCFNLGLVYLHFESTKLAIEICRQSIQLCPNENPAYFLQGIAYLWSNKEALAMQVWTQGLHFITDVQNTIVQSALIKDHNFRRYMYNLRFDVLKLMDVFYTYSSHDLHCDRDVASVFTDLKNNSFNVAITYFSLILKKEPTNLEALRGRGIAYCLLGRWQEAADDLDRNFPPELRIDALKFCSIALTSLGRTFQAIAKITQAIEIVPTDFEALVERAKMQMNRGCFALALQDFRAVPEQCYTERIWLYIAECLYSIGDIPRASEAIDRAGDEGDHRKYYCHFLILRDRGLTQLARKKIIQTTQLMPSFFLLRVAGDFMFDVADFESAAHYYNAALQQNSNDIETIRLYALALFQSGNEVRAYNILHEVVEKWQSSKISCDYAPEEYHGFAVDGPLMYFNRSTTTTSEFEKLIIDFVWIGSLIHEPEKSILCTPRIYGDIDECISKAASFTPIEEEFKTYELTESHLRIIKDADRIGERCFPRAPEVVDNLRIMRGLGFCVLYLAQHFRMVSMGASEGFWREAFEALKIIMCYADIRSFVDWWDAHPSLCGKQTPSYVLQNGERRSPRFGLAINSAISQIRNHIIRDARRPGMDLCQLTTLESLYAVAQRDVTYTGNWCELAEPTVTLRSLGIHGFSLTVSPTRDVSMMERYERTISRTWSQLVTSTSSSTLSSNSNLKANQLSSKDKAKVETSNTNAHSEENTASLGMLMFLIWSSHPFSHYSNEFAHVLMHAYALAEYKKEIGRLNNGQGELFIKHMVQPSHISVQSIVANHVANSVVKQEYSEEHLSFWNTLPKVNVLLAMFSAPFNEPQSVEKQPTDKDDQHEDVDQGYEESNEDADGEEELFDDDDFSYSNDGLQTEGESNETPVKQLDNINLDCSYEMPPPI